MTTVSLLMYGLWLDATHTIRQRLVEARDDERGEVTATTAMIVLLVIAAIAAGGVIADKLLDNANNVPSP